MTDDTAPTPAAHAISPPTRLQAQLAETGAENGAVPETAPDSRAARQAGESSVRRPASASPPTRKQAFGPSGTPPPTRLQTPDGPGAASGTRLQGSDSAAAGGTATADPEFPQQLADLFEPVELRGVGSEGAVWRVRGRDGRETLGAVKVYWTRQPVDEQLVAHLRSDPAFARYCPALGESGRFVTAAGPRFWIELEYLPETLAELLSRESAERPLPADRSRALLRELANGIAFWQDRIERNPLDYKPDNLLVRRARGTAVPQIVLADFGGAAAFSASQTIGDAMTTLAYAPPEQLWRQKTSPWPWWSLGEIAYEIATGVPRYRSAAGGVKDDSLLARDRVLGADLSAVADPRWRMLISGLLTQDPDDRWTAPQVSTWLAGGSPPVATPSAVPPKAAAPTYSPLAFRGVNYHDPALLAEAMTAASAEAEQWLGGGGARRLQTWLREEVKDTAHDVAYLIRLADREETRPLAVTAIAAAYAPQIAPRYRGRAVDADGLSAVLAGDADGAFARELDERGVLAIAAAWTCAHLDCLNSQRCLRLDHAAAHVSDAVAAARREAIASSTGTLAPAEEGRAYQISTMLAVRPEMARTMLRENESGRGVGVVLRSLGAPWAGPDWWKGVRRRAAGSDPRGADGLEAWTAAIVLSPRMVRERTAAAAAGATAGTGARPARATAENYSARVGEALLGAAAAALVGWTSAVLRGIANNSQSSAPLSVTGRMIGTVAAIVQYEDLGLFLAAGVFAVLLAHLTRHPAPLFFVPIGIGAAPGLTGYLPAFQGFTFPAFVETWLVDIGGFWRVAVVWVGVAYAIGAAFLCARAIRVANRRGGLPSAATRTEEARALTRLRRQHRTGAYFLGALVLLACFAALSWSVGIVCNELTYGMARPADPLPADRIGCFLPLLVVLAAVATLAARWWAGFLPIGAALVVYGTVAPRFTWPGILTSAPFQGLINHVDGLLGSTSPWVAFAVSLTAVAYGLPAVYRATAGK